MRSSRRLGRLFLLGALATAVVLPLGLAPSVAATGAPERAASVGAASSGPLAAPAAKKTRRDFPDLPKRCYTTSGPTAVKPQACALNGYRKNRGSLVLWGDSHLQEYLPAIRQATRGKGVNLVSFISGGCPPAFVPPRAKKYPNCEASNRAALDWIRKHRDAGERVTVLLSSQWTRWRQYWRNIVRDERAGRPSRYSEYYQRIFTLAHQGIPPMFGTLGRLGVRVDVVGPSGTYRPHSVPDCARGNDPYRCVLPRDQVLQEERATDVYLAKQFKKLPRYHVIDTSPAYCNAEECRGTVRGVATFFDQSHLSQTFSSTLGRYFAGTARRAAG